jgi:hypothetical protein
MQSRPHPIVMPTFLPRPVRPITLKVAPQSKPQVDVVFPPFDPSTVPPNPARLRGQALLLAMFAFSLTLSWLLGG